METFNFITVRLGKDSIPEIQKIYLSETGVLENPFTINVKCTQVPDNYGVDDYAFLWLGSDNNKGMPTQWKQGFKAIGRVANLMKGKSYNDTSETTIKIVYVFHDAINRMDILRCAPIAYYWCSSMPLIGLDDHANQTIRNMSGSTFADLRAFFSAIEAVTNHFKKDILQIEPKFEQFFDFVLPNPQSYPTAKNLNEISILKHLSKKTRFLQRLFSDSPNKNKFLPYLTALRTKPFMLLAGISGTGKSRIVRELAKACWKEGDEEFGKNHPRNFCMVQVKPNWHDSSELFGYVSHISGKPEFVAGDFLKFVVKAWEETDVPYFLCLDEMNLAPVEQYFAEYLSVIESRKSENGVITTDPIFKKPYENKVYDINIKYGEEVDWYQKLIIQLTSDEDLQRQFYKDGISIPNNLFVVGTVNMDETTFSFSRKVLDRAMTIEMNEVDLHGGLTDEGSEIGYIGNCIIGTAAEGKDVYADNKELCDQILAYLEKVNAVLEGTPFKIAYRTRNEFLLYAVNRQILDKDSQLWQTLDEMTSMKNLSRIEGDSERTKSVLEGLKVLVEEEISEVIPEPEEGKEKLKSISAAKIKEMLDKLEKSGYTSYWA